jgi:hypothetical protein
VSSDAARIAAFCWSFAEAALAVDGTARSRARPSCAPRSKQRRVGGINTVPKGASITATAIENFAD